MVSGDARDGRQAVQQHRGRVATIGPVFLAGLFLASCAGAPQTAENETGKTKEYFAESAYGVKASPRVTTKRSRVKRGGGREQVGKPYKVKGKWYYPKEDPDYEKSGLASWYGEAFHGRLTANGEIYDMTHLTAAHPTMPLPSYARVTNAANGSSIVVRVNDRGPFAHNRIIDLSKRAAQLLDYTQNGTAKVKVEYLGRAPLHGQDDQYLMASYRPGDGQDQPAGSDVPGVMVAMNGSTPSASGGAPAAPFPGELRTNSSVRGASMSAGQRAIASTFELDLPKAGPAVPERPAAAAPRQAVAMAILSYADERVARAARPFEALGPEMDPARIVASWKRGHGLEDEAGGYVAVGSFADRQEAERIIARLSDIGQTRLQVEPTASGAWYSVTLHGGAATPLDDLLLAAWDAGASEALPVRR
ncbi:septal ring lytic transglycosylase RlpA family protein [Mesorhizobium xinjiangense]|uniref:septal ring lytic transglycosylase RlpA family protein n=1 Tax=Mesorhizobium xinjiangense TaxID=2678685 RepID=UPI0012EE18AC|nr:septal ring lytic transglycosylase RlpA family protein [Mesorhizobium xinjiangense]